MRLILLLSNLRLTKFLLGNQNKLKTHFVYFQFHFISFFLLISLFNLEYNHLFIIFIIFLVGEIFLIFNCLKNKNNPNKYLLNANFFLYGIRISLIYLSLVFNNGNYMILLYILLISISIYFFLNVIRKLHKSLSLVFNNTSKYMILLYILLISIGIYFFLYVNRIPLIFLSLVFNNESNYVILLYILLISISIYKPLFKINLLTKELKYNNFIGLYIIVFITLIFNQILSFQNYLLLLITFLVTIFASTYTFGFKRLVNKPKSKLYKKDLEERKLFIDTIEYNNDFMGIKVDKDFKLITCYNMRKIIKNILFYMFLFILTGLIINRTFLYFNGEISNKLVFHIINMILLMLFLALIIRIFVDKDQFKYQMLESQDHLYLIINKNLNHVDIKKKKNNICISGLDLYKVKVNDKKYHFLVNS
ncbi:hypothetical protein KHQ81_00625 [Mycoplasmatota bacterium]|nr:hypothetical protein KHQ81_00625 [Mycoplasmatota bacterium]